MDVPIITSKLVQDGRINQMRECHLQLILEFHRSLNGRSRTRISCPCATSNAVVDVPMKHGLQPAFGIISAVQQHAKTTVHDLSPSYATPVVKADPCCTTKGISNGVVYRHVSGKHRSVSDVRGLSVRAIGS